MGDHKLQNEERIRQALHRYAGRFEPVQEQWARIEGRHTAATRTWRRRGGLLSLAATAIVVALVMVSAGVVLRPEEARLPAAQADFVGPEVPQYAGVVGTPVHREGSTMAAIQARGFIRVGIKFDQPNFGVQDRVTQKVEGFDADIAKLIAVAIFGGSASDIESRIDWKHAVSKNREALLQEGNVDIVVATYTINAERAQIVDFTDQYYLSNQAIMIRADDQSIEGIADLSRKKVCTVQGSTSLQNLVTGNPQADPVLRDTYSDCAVALRDGDVDAMTTDYDILAGYAHQGGGRFRILDKPLSPEPYGIGLHKGDEEFRSFLNRRLAEIVANGDLEQAERYWLSGVKKRPPAGS